MVKLIFIYMGVTSHLKVKQKQSSIDFEARSQNCEKRILASLCLSIRPSVCMKQLGSHWPNLMELES